MEPHPNIKSQVAALGLAAMAVVLFAVFEHALTGISSIATIDFYLAYRIVMTAGLYFLVLAIVARVQGQNGPGLCFDPRSIGLVFWGRALVTLWYLSMLTIGLALTEAQSATYPLFLLHPLWQIVAHRLLSGNWPSMSGRRIPFALVVLGVVAFAVTQGDHVGPGDASPRNVSLWGLAQAAALIAGIGFAFSNEIGARICASGRSRCLRGAYAAGHDEISGLEVTAYTTYAGLWLLPVMLPILIVGLDWLGLKSMLSTPLSIGNGGNALMVLTIGCVVIALGTWIFAEAFRRAIKTPQIAALDALILPLGAGLDLWSGKLLTSSAAFPGVMVSVLLIVVGVAWSSLREKP